MTSARFPGIFGAMFVAVVLGGCSDNPFGPNPQDVEFAASLAIDLESMIRSPSGLYYEDLVVGTGDVATVNDSVTVAFSEWLPDGDLLDGGEFTFVLGSADVIEGVSEGVTGMQLGGIRRLVVPSSLAYGEAGTSDGIVPQNAVLVFQIELTALGSPTP